MCNPNVTIRGSYKSHKRKKPYTIKLKLIDRLHTTRWTPPDYWQTDNSNGLIMVIRNYHWLNSASQVLILTCSAPLVQTGECKQFSLFDLDLWPTTLTTYNPRLAKVKIDPHAKIKVKRFKQESAHRQTDEHTRTHTDATNRIISPATRSIMNILVLLTFITQSKYIHSGWTGGK